MRQSLVSLIIAMVACVLLQAQGVLAAVADNIVMGGGSGGVILLDGALGNSLATIGSVDPGAPGGAIVGTDVQSNSNIVAIDANQFIHRITVSGSTLSVGATSAQFGTALVDVAVRSDNGVYTYQSDPGGGALVHHRDGSSLGFVGFNQNAAFVPAISIDTQSDNDVALFTDSAIYLRKGSDLTSQAASGLLFTGIVDGVVRKNDDKLVIITANSVIIRNDDDFLTGFASFGGFGGGLTTVETLSNGQVVVADALGNVMLRDATTLSGVATVSGLGNITALTVRSDDSIVVGNSTGDVYVYDATLSSQLLSRNVGGIAVESLSAVSAIPEPSASIILLGAGCMCLISRVRNRVDQD